MRALPPTSGERRTRPAALAIGVLVLLVPLGVLFLLSRDRTRRIADSPAPAESAPSAVREPRILGAAQSGVAPFGNLREPRDAAVDDRGRVWIADFGNSFLRIYDGDGGYLGGWGGKGDGLHGFRDLAAVTVAGGDVYVADTWNGRIAKFGLGGEPKGTATGLFGPRGIAVGPDGHVWVSDTGNHRIAHYEPSLATLDAVGSEGDGPGQFSSPVGIAVAPGGTIYVADTGNRRIVVLDSSGGFEAAWEFPGWDRAVEPHLEIDADGSVWATDPGSAEALLHFDGNGRVMESRTTDEKGNRFSLPTGLALDRKARILFVVNTGNNIVSKVRLAAGPGASR